MAIDISGISLTQGEKRECDIIDISTWNVRSRGKKTKDRILFIDVFLRVDERQLHSRTNFQQKTKPVLFLRQGKEAAG